ncbi:hypothetical protein [Streptomyces sp. NPDC005799]|uniref:hypothetical protein n=1 Tax=Streptomyces sp. NPDC005799 TaxID=3154678 RepID=UPI0033FBE7B6
MKTKRILATIGVVAAAGVAPLIAASSASATVAQCTGIVQSYGYVVGAKVTTACGYGKLSTGLGTTANPICVTKLVQLGVSNKVANTACSWA